MRHIFIAVLIGVIALVIYNRGNEATASVASEQSSVVQEEVTDKSDEALDEWLIKLSNKENCPVHGVVDTNGERSKGKFCFQDRTYKSFSKKYGVYDQYELAKTMITKEKNGWKHWRCSVIIDKVRCPSYTWKNPIGLPPLEKPLS